MTNPRLDQLIDELVVNHHGTPVIGASLVPLVLRAQGIEVVPCLQGGQIMPTIDRVSRLLKQVFFKTEQGLTFAVLGMAKAGRRPYVGIVTSGPGGLNTVTALADASRDCAPMGIIAGQVPKGAIGTDAFQGTDICEVTRPITKSSRLVESVDQLVESIPRDLGLAASGRPGSVLWDLPKDVQFTPIDLRAYREKIRHFGQFVETPPLDTEALDRAIQLLYESETPVIMAGYGLALAEVFDEFHELLEKTKLPVIHTLPGKSAVNCRYDNNLGMLGMHGLYPASAASYHADFILSLGARYDDRAVGNPEVFAPKAQARGALVHVDTEETQFHKARDLAPNKLNVLGDAGAVVKYLLDNLDPGRIKLDSWLRQTEKWKKENTPPKSEYASDERLDVIYLLETINAVTASDHEDKILVTDVGNHQMWAAQRLEITGPNSFLTSSGIGTMGSGIPQALGAQLAHPNRLVIDVQGDEGFFCCGSELRTAARYSLPIKVIIINNGSQCIVRQWTTNMFDGNNVGVIDHVDGIADMDFVTNAQSYGVEAERVTRKKDLGSALRRAIRSQGPYVLDCVVPYEECYPWIKPGTGFPQILTRKRRVDA